MISWLWGGTKLPKYLVVIISLLFLALIAALSWFLLYPVLGELVLELQNGLIQED